MGSRFAALGLSTALALAACNGGAGGPGPAPGIAPDTGEPSAAARATARAVNEFTVDLWKRAPRDGNAAASPFGVAGALAMVFTGARGATAAEMAKVCRFDADPARNDAAWRAFLAATGGTQAKGGVTISVANGLWVQKGFAILASYRASVVANHGADARTVDFTGDPAAAISEINDWTSDRTGGLIRELLRAGDTDAETRLVLTNAVHFKGRWDDEFDRDRTQPTEFRGSGGKRLVPTMNDHRTCGFAPLPGLKILELDYRGGDASMVLVLPDADDGLPAVEASLTAQQLDLWLAQVRRQEVAVAIPRFQVNLRLALADTLATMGMPTVFTDAADLSGIDGRPDLCIQRVIHEAVVVVDEEGTEAAAATGVALGVTSEPAERREFIADHPFLFLIRDRRTGAILFLGRVADPR